jgi:acetolactate synthase-1/2/3 large subunit
MLRHDQVRAGHEPFGVDLRSPDFVALAGSFGVEASAVDGFGEAFRERLAEYVRRSGPNVLVVRATALKPPVNTSPRWYRKASS